MKIKNIAEGQFVGGKKNGYCRVMGGEENEIHYGVYKDDVMEGKWACYTIEEPIGS